MKEKLKEIINAGAGAINKDSRAFVYKCATDLGIAFEKKRCASCVVDLAVLCVAKLNEGEAQPQGLHLKKGVDIIVNGYRVCEATCSTTEEIEKALSIGTPRKYFEE